MIAPSGTRGFEFANLNLKRANTRTEMRLVLVVQYIRVSVPVPDGMGLQSGEFGPKAVVKKQFSEAVCTIDSLECVTKTVGNNTAAMCIVADGNVLVSGTPQSVNTLEDYVNVLATQIGKYLKAANHVVVVFDEPAHMTRAKQEEQAFRDTRRKPAAVPVSDDVQPLPLNDEFDSDSLPENVSIRAMYNSRGSRSRIIDMLSMRLINLFARRFEACLPGTPFKSLTIDGIDGRGAKRPQHCKREPSMVSTSDSVAELLARDQPIGEGDAKLTVVTDAIRTSRADAASPFYNVSRVVVTTVDTDSIVIELLAYARRTELEHAEDDFKTYLCFRERAQQAGSRPVSKKRSINELASGDNSLPLAISHYTAIDVAVLYANVMLYLFTATRADQIDCIQPVMRLRAVSLFALGAIMCGTDFTLMPDGHKGVRGLRFDEVLLKLRDICTDAPHPLAALDSVWKWDDPALLRISAVVHDILQRVAGHLEGVPRRKKNAELVRATDCAMVKKCLWNLSYFHGLERLDTHNWGYKGC